MRPRLLVIAVLLGLFAAACATAEANSGPPEINFGRDICVQCGMIIDDARFAAAYRLDDGTEKTFDDVGGLILQGRETEELDTASEIWVADFETEEWLDARQAHYVPTLAVASPMGHGLLAFGDAARAARFASDIDGEAITWDLAAALPVTDGLVGHHHGDAMEMDSTAHDHDG